MAKKSSRIKVGLVCKETGRLNYVTTMNKLNLETFQKVFMRYCPLLMKHTPHVVKKKLD
ncbi:MAG: 50S ribosomal protein L33 [Patescibacteria group bacterium]|nr:50S ribosomal protein L33 [Patescibacteria group bacterium]